MMTQLTNSGTKSVNNVGKIWSELRMAWKTYKIAKMREDKSQMFEYAKRIQVLQKELGIDESKFPELNQD